MDTLHCVQFLELQPGFLRHVKFSPFGTTATAIAEERFTVMLVFRTETPLFGQVFRKLLVECLTDVLGHYRQKFEGTASILACECRLIEH